MELAMRSIENTDTNIKSRQYSLASRLKGNVITGAQAQYYTLHTGGVPSHLALLFAMPHMKYVGVPVYPGAHVTVQFSPLVTRAVHALTSALAPRIGIMALQPAAAVGAMNFFASNVADQPTETSMHRDRLTSIAVIAHTRALRRSADPLAIDARVCAHGPAREPRCALDNEFEQCGIPNRQIS
jgi:hypothetical protein